MKSLLTILFAAGLLAAQSESTLTVNGARAVSIEPGEALIVALAVTSPAGALDAAQSVTLSLAGADGRTVDVPLAERRSTSATVLDYEVAMRLWTIAPDATAQLAPGVYTLAASDGSLATLEVRATMPAEGQQHAAMKALVLSQWYELEGDLPRALAAAVELIGTQPENLAARLRKADVLAAASRPEEALAELDAAELLYYQLNPGQSHPPVLILRRQRAVVGTGSAQ